MYCMFGLSQSSPENEGDEEAGLAEDESTSVSITVEPEQPPAPKRGPTGK